MGKILLQIILFVFPWSIRRQILNKCFNYKIDKKARIGKSIILAKELIMADGSHIGSFTFCKRIDKLQMGKNSNLGNFNMITGFPTGNPSFKHFLHRPTRRCELIVGEETGITSRHFFDCNGGIYIGNFSQIAGYETTFLSHSIDLENNRQDVEPIVIGDYCFIGTRCTFIKGSIIPDKSVVGACSLVNKRFEESNCLYAGVPVKKIKDALNYQFFERKEGFVI